MKKRLISLFCAVVMLFSFYSFMIPVHAEANSGEIIEGGDVPLRLHYDEETPYGNENAYQWPSNIPNDGWDKWSLPIGNGYFGVNVFGRTETERVQITEKTLANPYYRYDSDNTKYSLGGLNNFSETYIDFGHTNSAVTDYSRWLDLETAISGVSYGYNGVTYTREYFTSYPDKALVIRLDASGSGNLSFTLRPTVPYQQDYAAFVGDGASKTGEVTSKVTNGVGEIELSGKMGYFDIDFLGLYKVYTNGGTVTAGTTEYTYTDTAKKTHTETNGTINVKGATSAYIVITLGTDSELSEELFTSSDKEKPTFDTTLADTRIKVEGYMNAILAKLSGKGFEAGYSALKSAHVEDYSELFSRVSLNLGSLEDASLTTDVLLEKYKKGDYSTYLEALYFQYGRYLLIASSREGALPANLQGAWNRYNFSPWGSGYWHNVNVQMNYWPAFSTNLAETFISYWDYMQAYMPAAEANADYVVNRFNKDKYDEDGGNGWCIGVSAFPNEVQWDRSAGNLGFTTQLLWDYYEYTKDSEILEAVYKLLVSAARFIVKSVELTEDGYYLVSHCDSPEMFVDGVWYYTVGTTYAQTFAYTNNYNALLAASELGIDFSDESREDYAILQRVLEQIDKYDPINVGLSGQIKEFREEDYYCSIGDEPQHRHTSQLVGLYPGNIINSTTPAWIDASKVVLEERGDDAGNWGWGIAFRLNMWARTKEGDRTYKLLNNLLTKATAPNLWDSCSIFQIDGNFGGTAGITEMLLQSHEGYIAPLSAIPSAWSEGFYTGLVARGNFEVAAKWQNGIATVFNITSNSGGRASISYSGITSAVVTTASGKKVDFTVSGKDLISFDTVQGETYIISGFTVPAKVNDVSSINAERAGLGPISIDWSKTEGVSGYNLYVAADNAADYTLLTSTSETSYVYTPDEENINSRFTFKVKAYDAEGNESKGAIVYMNPVLTEAELLEYEANVFLSGELQIVVKASENTKAYKLWRLAEGSAEYELVKETKYPIIIYENYLDSDKYAVSLVSTLLDDESEKYEIRKFKSELAGSENTETAWVENILLGKDMVPNPDAPTNIWDTKYGYDKLTDGLMLKQPDGTTDIHKSRFSAKSATDVMDGTVRLGGTYLINEVRIYDYYGSGNTIIGEKVEVYVLSDGKWVKAGSVDSRSAIIASKKRDEEQSLTYLPISLGYIAADAIRVVCSNDAGDGNTDAVITFYEITASGIEMPTEWINYDNVFAGKKFTGNLSPHSQPYGYDKLTDGDFGLHSGRFSLADGAGQNLVLECDLGALTELDFLRVYDLCDSAVSRVASLTLEVYYKGQWTKVIDGATMPAWADRPFIADGISRPSDFSLNGVKAEKVRFTITNTTANKGLSFYEIECSGRAKDNGAGTNILSGKTFTSKNAIYSSDYSLDKLTDGDYGLHTGRCAFKSTSDGKVTVECDLDGLYELYELKMYDFCNNKVPVIGSFDVELYYCGEWVKVMSGVKPPHWDERVYEDIGRAGVYNLGGAKGEKIRFTFTDQSANGISIYEILLSGVKSSDEAAGSNILLGNTSATLNQGESCYGDYPLTNAFDGKKNTRYALRDGKGYSNYTLEIDLGKVKTLYNLNIYDFRGTLTDLINNQLATRSNDTDIELYVAGHWVKVISGASMRVDQAYTSFDLKGIPASKIRISFNNTKIFDDGSTAFATIYEITLSAGAEIADRAPMLEVYEKLDKISYGDAHSERMAAYKGYLAEFNLDSEEVAAYAAEMSAYYETVKNNVISYVPKTSITLGSELSVNIYLPTKSLQRFTLDGVTYENLELLKDKKLVLSNGEEYYKMTILLPVSEAGREINLKAFVSSDEVNATVTFTISIPKYSTKAIEKGTDVEKALIRDVLSYIRAGYVFFEKDESVIGQIDAIIGANYDATSHYVPEGSTDVPTMFKAATFNLDSTPAIRFYLNDGENAENCSFKINGTAKSFITSTNEKGTYVEIPVYAYAMCETIECYYGGSYVGSYHIASYHNWARTQGNEKLITLVERFWKYCQSARDYRNNISTE